MWTDMHLGACQLFNFKSIQLISKHFKKFALIIEKFTEMKFMKQTMTAT